MELAGWPAGWLEEAHQLVIQTFNGAASIMPPTVSSVCWPDGFIAFLSAVATFKSFTICKGKQTKKKKKMKNKIDEEVDWKFKSFIFYIRLTNSRSLNPIARSLCLFRPIINDFRSIFHRRMWSARSSKDVLITNNNNNNNKLIADEPAARWTTRG